MTAKVRLETRHTGSGMSKGKQRETVILRNDEVVAVLPEGDPLHHTLELSLEELRSMRVNLARALERRPWVTKVLDAIIEYKEAARGEPPRA